jgi:uncharacterized coiled-coil protein SlyX
MTTPEEEEAETETETLRARIAAQEQTIQNLNEEIARLSKEKGVEEQTNNWRIIFLKMIKWDLIFIEILKWVGRGLIGLGVSFMGFAIVWIQQVWQTVSTLGKAIGK